MKLCYLAPVNGQWSQAFSAIQPGSVVTGGAVNMESNSMRSVDCDSGNGDSLDIIPSTGMTQLTRLANGLSEKQTYLSCWPKTLLNCSFYSSRLPLCSTWIMGWVGCLFSFPFWLLLCSSYEWMIICEALQRQANSTTHVQVDWGGWKLLKILWKCTGEIHSVWGYYLPEKLRDGMVKKRKAK